MKQSRKQIQRVRRKARVRAKVSGTQERPRLSVFRSNKHVYVQLIDDESSRTLASASSQGEGLSPKEEIEMVGKRIAEEAKKLGVNKMVFDTSGYKYEGNIARLADTVRAAGIDM